MFGTSLEVGAFNVAGNLRARGGWDSSEVEGSFAIGVGGSVDYHTGEVGGTVSITGKTLWDEGANLYNEHIDPLVDDVMGRDVPGLGEASDFWDRGVTINVKGKAGVGQAAEAEVDGKLDTSSVGLGGKLRVPAVVAPFNLGASVDLDIRWSPDDK